MYETLLINSTGDTVKVNEGTGGVYRLLTMLEHGGTFKLRVDPNATYRETYIHKLPDGMDWWISSDDLCQFATIELPPKPTGNAEYVVKLGKRGASSSEAKETHRLSKTPCVAGSGTAILVPGLCDTSGVSGIRSMTVQPRSKAIGGWIVDSVKRFWKGDSSL